MFEDTEDDEVWMHERRLAKDPVDFESECTKTCALDHSSKLKA